MNVVFDFGKVIFEWHPHELVARLLRSSAYVLALGKRAFYSQDGLREDAAYDLTCEVMVDNAGANDAHEGMHAFLEKRAPVWEN